mmetsp:Transcript_4034/g.5690  ORF Transcript_4034/g.5690 Transcript_4034/m.5690 type:complete len:93 (-) Transcript_4034:365-643(-)
MMVDEEVPIKWSFVFHFGNDAFALCVNIMFGFAVLGKWGYSLKHFHGAVSDFITHCCFFEVAALEEVIEMAINFMPAEADWGIIDGSEEGDP